MLCKIAILESRAENVVRDAVIITEAAVREVITVVVVIIMVVVVVAVALQVVVEMESVVNEPHPF